MHPKFEWIFGENHHNSISGTGKEIEELLAVKT